MHIVNNGGVCTPLGFTTAACAADIKGKGKGNNDLALLISDVPAATAALFTTNLVAAAPVRYDKEILAEYEETIGIIVNTGNANACTGEAGFDGARTMAKHVEEYMELPEKSILVASTGVIGTKFPIEKIVANIPSVCDNLDDEEGSAFAKAILTTDTVHKEIAVVVDTEKGSYSIGGACKGAGMIDPSMATMLCFITTDAMVDADELQDMLEKATKSSFNCITVDGDMSTNDSVFAFANGMSEVEIDNDIKKYAFLNALSYVCKELALMIVKDGEGATKLVTIDVKGAKSEDDARKCAGKIANSPLVKTMFAGCDPNWGRLMSSAGASGAEFDPEKVSIYIDELHYVENGTLIDESLEEKAYKIMKNDAYTITINLYAGSAGATYYTCDLTKAYIEINADYRS